MDARFLRKLQGLPDAAFRAAVVLQVQGPMTVNQLAHALGKGHSQTYQVLAILKASGIWSSPPVFRKSETPIVRTSGEQGVLSPSHSPNLPERPLLSSLRSSSNAAAPPPAGGNGAAQRGGWPARLGTAWEEAMGGVPPIKEIGRNLKPLVDKHGVELVERVLRFYLSRKDPEYASAADLAKRFGVFQDEMGGGH